MVSIACRMESNSLPNRILVTDVIREKLKDRYVFEDHGEIQVKGKGAMKTWFLAGTLGALKARVAESIADHE